MKKYLPCWKSKNDLTSHLLYLGLPPTSKDLQPFQRHGNNQDIVGVNRDIYQLQPKINPCATVQQIKQYYILACNQALCRFQATAVPVKSTDIV